MFRRLMAGLLVFGILVAVSVPAIGQDKKEDKDKDKAKAEGAPVTLEWKLEKDKVFYQKMVTTTNQTMNIMGNDVTQKQTQTFYFSWKPTAVDKEKHKATIEQEIIGVQMTIEIGGSTISYNSVTDTTVNNPLADFFKALVGSKFIVDLDTKDLKVTKVDGRDEFIKKLAVANPAMKQLLEQILSADALKEMAEPTFAVIDTKPMVKGQKWKRSTKLSMGPIGTYENEYNYVYEGSEGTGDKEVYKIKVDTKLTYKQPEDAAGAGGLPFKIKGASLTSSNPVGRIVFSKAKGRLEEYETKLELKGDLTIEIGGQATKVKLSQVQESKITTTDENPVAKKK